MFTDITIPIEIDHGGQFNFPISIKTDNQNIDILRLVLSSIRTGDTQNTFIDTFDDSINNGTIEQNEIDDLHKKFTNLELLGIDFYEKNVGDNIYYQGFLGKINNITIQFRSGNYVFIFGNGFGFDCENFNDVHKKSGYFNIFINRFLPDLLDNNKFNNQQKRNIEKFMFQYI